MGWYERRLFGTKPEGDLEEERPLGSFLGEFDNAQIGGVAGGAGVKRVE